MISEQEALKEFIEKNLNIGFIQPNFSLHSVPVLFVKKKDGSLCLCVNFCGFELYFQKELLSTPVNFQSTGLTSQSSGIYKDISSLCLLLGLYCQQWWMENYFQDILQIIQVVYNVFWSY